MGSSPGRRRRHPATSGHQPSLATVTIAEVRIQDAVQNRGTSAKILPDGGNDEVVRAGHSGGSMKTESIDGRSLRAAADYRGPATQLRTRGGDQPFLHAPGRRRSKSWAALQFRPEVEGLRAVAVLLVFADHLFGKPVGGSTGVEVFFVISGFLITGVLEREYSRTQKTES